MGSVASNPTNIATIAIRAVKRQPEYSFAPAHDQWHVKGSERRRGLTHIDQGYFLFPVMISHSNQRVVKNSHLSFEFGTQRDDGGEGRTHM
jgi:hypothetical protein